jgi:hypothetical protein
VCLWVTTVTVVGVFVRVFVRRCWGGCRDDHTRVGDLTNSVCIRQPRDRYFDTYHEA